MELSESIKNDPFVECAVDKEVSQLREEVAQQEVSEQASQMAQQLLEEVTKTFATESQPSLQTIAEQNIEQPFVEFKEQPFVAHQQYGDDPFADRDSPQFSYESDVKQQNIDDIILSGNTGVTSGADIESYDELMFGSAKQRFMESAPPINEEEVYALNRDDPFGTPKHHYSSEPYETISTDFGMGSVKNESDLLGFEASNEEAVKPTEVSGFVAADYITRERLLQPKLAIISDSDHSQSSSDDEEKAEVLHSHGNDYSTTQDTTQSTLSQQFQHNVTNDASICVSSAPNVAKSSDSSSPPNLEQPKVEAQQRYTASKESSNDLERKTQPIAQQKPQHRDYNLITEPAMAQQLQQSSTSAQHESCPFAPSAWFNCEQLHPNVAELVFWRNPKKSGIVFGAGLTLLLSLSFFSIISVVAYASLITLMVTLSFRIYKNILQAVQKTNEGHPFKEYLEVEITPSNDRVHQIVDTLLGHLNCTVNRLRSVFLVEDIIDSLKYVLFFWSLTYIGSWFNGLTLVILSYLAMFSLPKVYEMNKTQIDYYLQLARNQISEIANKISAKIPFPAKKEKEN